MTGGKGCCAIMLAAVALLFPVDAFAAAPANVRISASGGQIVASWDDPSIDGNSVTSAIEIAHSPKVAADGSFSDPAKIRAPLGEVDTSYKFPPLPNGTYYVHVGAYALDAKCDADPNTGELVCPTDWSPTITLKIGPGGPAVSDTVVAFKSLRVAKRQKAASLIVEASMAERGTISVAGTVSVPNAAKVFKVKPVSATAVAGKAVKVRVKLSKAVRRAITGALARHRKVTAKLTITARDLAGNRKAEKRSVRLR